MTATLTDFTFDVTGNATTLEARVEVDANGGTGELAFDNIRVLGTVSASASPVLANIETTDLTYNEGDAATLITSTLTTSDTDSPNLTGGSVSITTGFVSAQDRLVFSSPQNGITGTFDNNTGVLTLTGTASLANYQTALRSVRYQNIQTVTAIGGLRVANFNVTDGTSTSNPQSRNINVVAQLNAPATLPYTEDFETDGEGLRYASNTWSTSSPCLGFLRTNLNPYTCSPVTLGNISNSYYWYSEGTSSGANPNTVDIGTMVLAPVNATNYGNLTFAIRLGTGQAAQWESDDYIKFFYRVNGGAWVPFGAFYGNGTLSVPGELQRDTNLDGVADGGTGSVTLNSTMQNVTLALPPAVTGASIDFMIEINSDGQEELSFDRIVVAGTLNNAPVIANQTRSIAENSANGTNVGAAIAASDPDGQTLTYAITAGNTSGTFAINNSTGQLTVANSGALNFEAIASYALTVQVTDNGTPASSSSATITVNVTNVNEAPSISPQTFSIAENSANGTTVGTVVASDPDAGTTLTYSITAGNTGGAFSFVGNSLRVANAAALDFETTPTFALTVQVSDGALTSSATVTVNLNDVDDTPPSVAITSSAGANGGSTSTTPITFTFTFSENVTGFVANDVTVTGGSIVAGSLVVFSATTYSLQVTPAGNGTVTVNVAANVAQDAAGNGNTAAPQFSITYTAATAMVVSVTRLTPSPTATAQVSYRVVFSASVTGVTVNNFTTVNSGTTVTGSSVSSASGAGTTYTVTVNTGTGNGTLRLDVANSTGITPTVTGLPYTSGEVYTITKSFAAAPQLTIVGTGGTGSDVTAFVDVAQVLSGGSPFANALQNSSFETHAPLAFGNYGYNPTGASWTFSALSGIAESGSAFTPTTPVPDGIAVAFVQSDGGSGGNHGQLQQNLALPTGSNYQVSFRTAQRVCCTTQDQALNVFLNGVFLGNIQPNSNAYTTFTSATFAVTAPALTATVSSSTAANNGSSGTSLFAYTVTFSQSVTNFVAGDVVVGNGTLTGFTAVNGTTYTFNVTPTAGGPVTVSVPANVATDANNTDNTASNGYAITYNQPVTAAPVVTFPTSTPPINTATPTYTGTAAAGSTVKVYVDNFSIGSTTATGGNFTLLQPAALAQGSHTVYATAQSPGAAVSANSIAINFTVDTVRPTVAISSTAGTSGSTTTTAPIPFTVTFSENVTGFVGGDVTVTNGSITGNVVNGSGTTYTFTVTPTTPGTATTVNVPTNVAQDAASNFNTAAPAAYSLTFLAPTTAVAPAALPAGTQGVAYSQVITASGGTAPYSFAVTAGALPAGLTLSGGGTLAGTPTVGGSFTFTIRATDASAAPRPFSGSASYTLVIGAPTIVVAPATLPNGTQGVAYSQAITASGGTAPYSFVVTAGALPAGLSLASNGTLSGTPTANGSFPFTVTAIDASTGSGPYTGSLAYTLVIAAPAPTVTVWTGNLSTDWFTAGNWTAGVPTVSLDATVPAGRPNSPSIAAGTASVRNLTLNAGTTLAQTGGTLDVRANLTSNGTFQPTGGTVVLGTIFQSNGPNLLGSSAVRFWNLTVNANGVLLSTSAGASVQRLLTLNGALVTQGNVFTLESNAASTALVVNNPGGFVFGTATVQRYLDPSLNPGPGYRHYSSPVQSTTVADLTTPTFTPMLNSAYNTLGNTVTPFPTVFGYDESRVNGANATTQGFDQGFFSPVALSDALTVGRGYTVNIDAASKVDLTGPLNNGPVGVGALSRGTEANSGWHLLGNPYPAPLDWNVARTGLPTGVIDAVYVFKSAAQYTGTYQFFQNGFGTLPGGSIGSMQGFFVRVSQPVAAFSFLNAWRSTVYQNPTFNRTTADLRPSVQLELVSAQGARDAAFVYFEQGATAGLDDHYDATKLLNTTGLNLASVAIGQNLAVNGLPLMGNTSLAVPLSIGLPATGTYTLHAAQLLNFGSGEQPFLRDLQLNTLTDLSLNPDYRFTMNSANTTPRFELVFGAAQVLSTASAALARQVAVFPNPASKAVFVELPPMLGRKAVTAGLVDALGRTVLTQVLPAGLATHTLPLANVATGVYSLRLQTEAGVVVKKLVVE